MQARLIRAWEVALPHHQCVHITWRAGMWHLLVTPCVVQRFGQGHECTAQQFGHGWLRTPRMKMIQCVPMQGFSRAAELDASQQLPASAQLSSLTALLARLSALCSTRGGLSQRQAASVAALLAKDAAQALLPPQYEQVGAWPGRVVFFCVS